MEKPELLFVLSVSICLCTLSSLPYLFGTLKRSPDSQFTHVLRFQDDQNNYHGFARQATAGEWLFHNAMIAEKHRNVLFNLEWLLMGKLSSFLGLPLKAAMHIERIASIIVPCFAVYWLPASLDSSSTGTARDSLIEYFARHHSARTPSFHPIFFPSS